MRPRIASTIVMAVALSMAAPARSDDSSAEPPRSEAEKLQLVEKALQPWNAVTRWLIEYEAIPSETTAMIPVHKIMAVSETDYYHMSAHFPQGIPWQADPFSQELFVHDGRVCHRWRFNRAYSERKIANGDDVPGAMWRDVLFPIVPRWPLTRYKMPPDPVLGTSVLLVEGIQAAECRLLAKSEMIGGEACAVFDYKGVERIWIATNKGLCLMRRDIQDPGSKRLLERHLTDKVREFAPGLWLPAEYRVQLFRLAGNADAPVLERENRIRLLRCQVNDNVPQPLFVPVQPPGAIEHDYDANRFTQVSAGGEELLDDVVGFMTQYGRFPPEPVRRRHGLIWVTGGLAGGLGLSFLLDRAHKGRAKKLVPDTLDAKAGQAISLNPPIQP